MKFDKTLTSQAISILIKLAEKHRGKQFKLNNYRIVPKALYVCEGSICYFVFSFSQNIKNIKAIIIDVGGIHPEYATQLEIHGDGLVIVTPSQNRSEDDVKKFLETIINVEKDRRDR